jgi:hypothetical protein
MGAKESAQRALSFSQSEMVRGLINRTLIVDWVTVKEVLGDGSVVQVLLSVTDNALNATIVTCVLVSQCSSVLSVNLMPKVGDKVLVLSPRRYDSRMFDVTENTESIVNPSLRGYNKMTCIAILYNQFRPDTHKNSVDLTAEGALNLLLGYEKDTENDTEYNNVSLSVLQSGAVTLGLIYDKDNSVYKVNFAVSADGDVSLNVKDITTITVANDGTVTASVGYDSDADKYKSVSVLSPDGSATVSFGSYDSNKSKYSGVIQAQADGYLQYENKDGKTKFQFTSNKMLMQDANECKIESTANGVSGGKGIIINGKLKIKG